MKRITKREARRQFNQGKRVYFMPSRLTPYVTHAPHTIIKDEIDCTFTEYIRDYEESYCNSIVGNKVGFHSY